MLLAQKLSPLCTCSVSPTGSPCWREKTWRQLVRSCSSLSPMSFDCQMRVTSWHLPMILLLLSQYLGAEYQGTAPP